MSVTVSWTTLWRIFFMLVLAVVLYLAKDILLAFLLAIVISTALDPLVSLLEKKSIPRIIGTLLVFIMFGGLFAVLIYTVVPLAILESSKLLDNIGGLASSIFGASSQRVQMLQSVNQNLNNIGYLLLSGGGSILDAATALIGGAALVISIFVLSFYLTIGRDGVERFLRSVIPEQYEESVLNIYERVRRRTGRWFQVQLFLSLMMGCAVFIGLWILGVKYSLVLAILAAFFELVPIVGPIFAGSVAVLIALSDSLILGIYTLLMFLVIQQIESHIIIPVVMRRSVGLHPVVVIVSLLIGAQVAGFTGFILAIPAAFLTEEIIDDLASRRRKPSS